MERLVYRAESYCGGGRRCTMPHAVDLGAYGAGRASRISYHKLTASSADGPPLQVTNSMQWRRIKLQGHKNGRQSYNVEL